MSLPERFIQQQLFSPDDLLLVAVSGGVDSVVLCELCKIAGYPFLIAHVNFRLRGAESEEDERFVQELAAKYQVPFYIQRFDTAAYAQTHKLSVQVAARELRYSWFKEVMQTTGAKWLLTAHHADDNAETLLMNFFRGTGISGLRGMLSVTRPVARPLLPFNKTELVTFAREKQLDWREDSSNASDKYSRNYFRNVLLPVVRNIFPEAEQNLKDNLSRFRDIELLYQQAIDYHKKKLITRKGNEVHLPVLKLKQSFPLDTIVYELIRPYGFSAKQIPEVVHLLEAEQGKYVQSDTHRVIRNRNWLIIAAKQTTITGYILIEKEDQRVSFTTATGNAELELKTETHHSGSIPADDRFTAYMDLQEIKYPLILRKWKEGDYFYPLGMQKKKKVSRFLIDQKLSLPEKENTWVLESDRRICWIAGMRLDDRFKLKASTIRRLVVSLKRS